MFSLRNKRIWIAGHNGMVGGALCRRFASEECEILTVDRGALDLRRQSDVEGWLAQSRPDAVVLAAATVGGIKANSDCPADFIYDNLAIETNVIHGAYKAGVKKLLFLGSSCIYPKAARQPIKEEDLLSGALEPTNEWYALAKIAGIKMCQAYRRQHGCDFIAAMPCNLYGPGDTYDTRRSHVIPALILKMHEAKLRGALSVTLWGTGNPLREFMYVDDLADALVFLLQNYGEEGHINVGSRQEVSICDLALMIADAVGYRGDIKFDADMPDGVARKVMDSGRLYNRGWRPQTDLQDGLRRVYADYLDKTESGYVRAA